MFYWYQLLYYKEIPSIYWMTLVLPTLIPNSLAKAGALTRFSDAPSPPPLTAELANKPDNTAALR